MTISVQIKLLIISLVCSNIWVSITECKNKTKTVEDVKIKVKSEPVSVDSRFFDLGGILKQLFPNFNQGQPAGNPVTNFPQNSPTYPGKYQGNYAQAPNQGNFGNYPNQGSQSQGFDSQGSYSEPNQWQAQYPDQGRYTGRNNYPGRPDYYLNNHNGMPNQGNWRPDFNEQVNQYPNQGRPTQPPVSNGMNTQIQVPSNMPQDWNQQRPVQDPDSGRPCNYPNQGGQQPPHSNDEMNNPTINNYYPGNNTYPSRPSQSFNQQKPSQFPTQGQNQGGFQNSNNGNQNSGSLDDFVPEYHNGTQNAILGKPVKVPSTTYSPDQIVFEDSSESPLQTQCVQDCPSTSEYNPVCGTNNITYFNPGKFVCARNCGIKVFVARRGPCQRRPI